MELGDGWYSKNIDSAEFMRVRIIIDTDWRRMSVWIYGERITNSNINLTWIDLKPKVMQTMYLINIQYHMGNCHPSKTNVNRGEVSVDIGFLGVTTIHVTLSCSQHVYNMMWCYQLPNTISLDTFFILGDKKLWFFPIV